MLSVPENSRATGQSYYIKKKLKTCRNRKLKSKR